jgi:GH15 family glucan-1,4-alpha-glucosidase
VSAPGPGVASRYRPIGDYGFLGDCHTGALVSSAGSVDWLCLPRLDDGSYFGRLLDRDRGGRCTVTPTDPAAAFSRRYLDGTLVLQTEMTAAGGRVRVTDCLTMRPGGARRPYRQLLRSSTAWTARWICGSRWSPASTMGRCGRGSAAPDRPGRRWVATTGW